MDKKNPEDVDIRVKDHIYDALRYGIMSRPRFSIFDYDPVGNHKVVCSADATFDINMAEEDITLDSDSIALEDTDDSVIADAGVSGIIPFIQERYDRAEDFRRNDEERWLRSYTNYRGIYGSDVQFTEAERSRVFIKVTKTKTLAAYGQIVDVLFAGNKFPISIEPTVLPEGVAKDVSFDPKEPEGLREETEEASPYGFAGDGMELPKGATEKSLLDKLGPLEEKLVRLKILKRSWEDSYSDNI